VHFFSRAIQPDDEEADDEDEPVYKWGTVALDCLAKNLPSKVIVPAILAHVTQVCTVTHCTARHRVVTHCNALQRAATHCNALQRAATRCIALRRTATHCKFCVPAILGLITQMCTAMHRNALQHTATHCNTR